MSGFTDARHHGALNVGPKVGARFLLALELGKAGFAPWQIGPPRGRGRDAGTQRLWGGLGLWVEFLKGRGSVDEVYLHSETRPLFETVKKMTWTYGVNKWTRQGPAGPCWVETVKNDHLDLGSSKRSCAS